MKNALRIVAIVFCLLAWPAASSADQLVLPGGPTFLSTGDETIVFNGHVYFAADDGVAGNELWRTDGTPGGTTLVSDLNAGNATSDSNPGNFTLAGNRLFFRVGTTGVAGQSGVINYIDPGGSPQVAKLAGGVAGNATAAGLFGSVNGKALINFVESAPASNRAVYALGDTGNTFTKISSGSANVGSFPESATMGGYAYFPLCPTSCSAYELYRTDGSTVSLVKDIDGVASGSGPNNLVATGNRVYFEADDGTNGRKLWVTDGSDPGTKMVKDHNPSGSTGIGPTSVANGNTLFYIPSDPATGAEPWRTDGTPGGTSLVKDITPGATGGFGSAELFALGSGFGMVRNGDVYTSDGTEAGTIQVADVDSDGLGASLLGVANSRGYFRGGFSPFGGAVWRTDGTVAGTGALTAGEFNLATPGSKIPFAGLLTALGNKVIFFARYPQAAGDPAPADARRMYALDTAQPDQVRQATAAPSISGTPAVGQPLTGNQGTWTLEPHNEYAFQWLRNGAPIPGSNARNLNYKPIAADDGTQLSLRVTTTGIGLPNEVSAMSSSVTVGAVSTPAGTPAGSPTGPIKPLALKVSKKPKLTGEARVGERLKVKLPAFAQSGVNLTFQWFANGQRIKKQTGPSLKLKKAHEGKRITLKVIATKAGYTTLELKAGPTQKVKD